MKRTNQENTPTPMHQMHLNRFLEDHSSELLLTHIEELESQMPGHRVLPLNNETEVEVVLLTVVKRKDQVVKATGNVVKGHFIKKGTAWQIHYGTQMPGDTDTSMNPQLASNILDFIRAQRNNSTNYNLSLREKEILRYVVDGAAYKEIASQLFISLETVRTHIRHIYEKMRVKSKSQAVGKALKDRMSFL